VSPDPLPALHAGVYRHYKGGYYQVLGYAQESTNGEHPRHVVVYLGLTPGGSSTRMHVREAREFASWVHPTDGSTCDRHWRGVGHACGHGRAAAPRFEYKGPGVPA
jgi:hypothetical protein